MQKSRTASQYPDCLAAYRNLAWRGMEFPAMGIILCRLPSVRKVFLKRETGKVPGLHPLALRNAGCLYGMGAVCFR